MRKLLILLLLMMPLFVLAETGYVTTPEGLTLSFYDPPAPDLGGDTGELLIQGYCMDSDWEAAYALNLLLAEAGDQAAMVRLGNHCLTGLGTVQDEAAATAWYQRALDAGNHSAHYELGMAALHGWGMESDVDAAREHFSILADSGDWNWHVTQAAKALEVLESWDLISPLPEELSARPLPYRTMLLADDAMCLGYFWRNGEGGLVDHIEAARWFEKAIELSGDKGVAADWSHAALAEYYRNGTLGFYDIEKALEHAQGQANFHSFAGDIYYHGITAPDGTVILTPEVDKAIDHYQQGAEWGDADALAFLADCYYSGAHFPQDVEKSIDLYLEGMQLGSTHCADAAEQLYAEGCLYTPERIKRLAWAAANGHPPASANDFLLTFAKDLIDGKTAADGTVLIEPQQYQYAFWVLRHLGHTSRVNDVFVHNWLGWFYCGNQPNIQTADYRYAHSHYAQSAQLGDGYAFAQLGILYRDGKFVEADMTTARSCFQQAIALGYAQAQNYLDALDE